MAYYKDSKEYKAKSIIQVQDIQYVAEARTEKRPGVFGLVTKDRTFYLQAIDGDVAEWISFLKVEKIEQKLSPPSSLLSIEAGKVSGYAVRKGKLRGKRWLVLRGSCVYVYKNEKEYELLDIIDLTDCLEFDILENGFQVSSKSKDYEFIINQEFDEWIAAFKTIQWQ